MGRRWLLGNFAEKDRNVLLGMLIANKKLFQNFSVTVELEGIPKEVVWGLISEASGYDPQELYDTLVGKLLRRKRIEQLRKQRDEIVSELFKLEAGE